MSAHMVNIGKQYAGCNIQLSGTSRAYVDRNGNVRVSGHTGTPLRKSQLEEYGDRIRQAYNRG